MKERLIELEKLMESVKNEIVLAKYEYESSDMISDESDKLYNKYYELKTRLELLEREYKTLFYNCSHDFLLSKSDIYASICVCAFCGIQDVISKDNINRVIVLPKNASYSTIMWRIKNGYKHMKPIDIINDYIDNLNAKKK